MLINNKKIYFTKIKINAITPTKREEDMAYDVYACFDEDKMIIQPHSTKLIPTGIVSAFDKKCGCAECQDCGYSPCSI